MPLHDKNQRPGRGTEALKVARKAETIVPPSGDVLADLDALAAHVDGTFVLVVRVTAGRYRRRCFLTAKAAEAAARRATERGENATVYLAELKPLYRIAGGVG